MHSFSLDALYPEIKGLPAHRYLAQCDWGYQLAEGALYLLRDSCIPFYRLGQFHAFSEYLKPHSRDLKLQIIDFLREARALFNQASQFHHASLQAKCNAHCLNLLLATSDSERAQHLFPILMSANHSWKAVVKAVVKSPERWLDILAQNRDFHFLPISVKALEDVCPSVEERALSLSARTQLLTQSPAHSYEHVTWRASLVQYLINAEYPQQSMDGFQMGIQETPDPAFLSEAQFWGWRTVVKPEEPIDAVTLWHLASVDDIQFPLISHLKPGGLLLVAMPRAGNDPEAVRAALEVLSDSTVYLFDCETFRDILVAYAFKGQRFLPRLNLLIVLRHDSVRQFVGIHKQVFNTRAGFKEYHIRADISLALRLDLKNYDRIWVVGYIHERDKIQRLKLTQIPIACMPLGNVFFQSFLLGHRFYEAFCTHPEPLSFLKSLPASIQALPVPVARSLDWSRMAAIGDFFFISSRRELSLLTTTPDSLPYLFIPRGIHRALYDHLTTSRKSVIVCVARIEPNKNQLMLCYALRDTTIPIVLIGSRSTDFPDYLKHCQQVGNGRVHHLDEQSPEQIALALKSARVFVLTSFSEGPSIATVEAAAAGCPIVVTRCSLVEDTFGDTVEYCSPSDPLEIKAKVIKQWKRPDRRKIIRAQAIVRESCTWDKISAKLAGYFLDEALTQS